MDSVAPLHMRGTMLWFNEAKDLGALRTDDGVRIELPGAAFLPGEKPVGRCAGKVVEFESLDGVLRAVAFVPDLSPRRARLHRQR